MPKPLLAVQYHTEQRRPTVDFQGVARQMSFPCTCIAGRKMSMDLEYVSTANSEFSLSHVLVIVSDKSNTGC